MQLISSEYLIQGLRVTDIAKEFGTPVYVYDAERIFQQVSNLNEAFSGLNLKIKYAAKALTNQAILKVMKKAGIGLDVVSIQEVQLGLKAGFDKKEIMFTPNCTPYHEIEEAVALGVHLNIDNLPYLERFGKQYGDSYPLCIRVNPHIEAGGNDKIKTGHAESKFGISIDQIVDVYKIVKQYNINVSGLHVHTGSDFGSIEVFLKGAQLLFDIAKHFDKLQFIDFGSGFKVPYKEGDKATNLTDMGAKMREVFKAFTKEYGRELEIWFEPGKYLVSECGLLLTTANLLKTTPAATFVGVDSGLNHLIRPMMYGAYHDIVNISNPLAEKKKYAVVGYICETDTFGWDMSINDVREGDIIALKNAGAYGFSMSSNYNSRFRPAEVLIYQGKAHLIRKRETMDDLLRNQVEIVL